MGMQNSFDIDRPFERKTYGANNRFSEPMGFLPPDNGIFIYKMIYEYTTVHYFDRYLARILAIMLAAKKVLYQKSEEFPGGGR